jgi:hypothetical protein
MRQGGHLLWWLILVGKLPWLRDIRMEGKTPFMCLWVFQTWLAFASSDWVVRPSIYDIAGRLNSLRMQIKWNHQKKGKFSLTSRAAHPSSIIEHQNTWQSEYQGLNDDFVPWMTPVIIKVNHMSFMWTLMAKWGLPWTEFLQVIRGLAGKGCLEMDCLTQEDKTKIREMDYDVILWHLDTPVPEDYLPWSTDNRVPFFV